MNCGIISAARRRSAAAGDPNFSNVVLLMGFEGTNGSTSFVDESPVGRTMTANGNAQITTSQFKFGSSCAAFDGSGDRITAANNTDFAFGSGPFTIEGFYRFLVKTSDHMLAMFGNDAGFASGSSFAFQVESNSLVMRLWTTDAIGVMTASVSFTPTLGTWYHLAYDRDASNVGRIYRDGSMVATHLADHPIQATTGHLTLGAAGATTSFPGYDMNGNMDEVRITKGIARYGSDGGFTVPTSAYPRS
jgi:hypothetical protein